MIFGNAVPFWNPDIHFSKRNITMSHTTIKLENSAGAKQNCHVGSVKALMLYLHWHINRLPYLLLNYRTTQRSNG